MIGAQLGNYEVVSKLGEGGMGTVYLARHRLIGRKAAVKVVRPELSTERDVVDRFFNEARAATLIRNGGIVDVFDFGISEDGNAYLVMEFLEGESLADRMQRLGQMPEGAVLRLGRQAASALAAAHREGIIHRDLKPDNLLVVPDSEVAGGERIKILDFGIAKLLHDEVEGASRTRTGAIVGTPYYMAPEQCRGSGGELDGRVDVYALGCVLYEMLCARPPFEGRGVGEVLAMHLYESAVPPRTHAPGVSEALDSLIMCCLAKDPDERCASMDAVLTAIDGLRERASAATASAPIDTLRDAPAAAPAGELAAASWASPASRTGAFEAGEDRNAPFGTTLGRSSGQLARGARGETRPARRTAVVLAAALVLAAGAVTALVVGLPRARAPGGQTNGGEREGRVVGDAQRAAAAPRGPPGEPAHEPVTTFDAARAPETTVSFSITSRPHEASVWDGEGNRLGATPLELDVSKTRESLVYVVRKPGYEPARIELVADRDREHQVRLDRRERRPAARRRRASERGSSAPDDGAGAQEDEPTSRDPFGSRK